MLFCPTCGNLLLVRRSFETSLQEFYCQTCPYTFPISPSQHFISRTELENRKQVDDVLGGSDAWKNVDTTDATCPKCENGRAYFMQIQIRSADEPSSIFYKCVKCSHQWREG